jgi:hypothetical protein
MEEITKEWPTNFLKPFDQEDLSEPDLIGNWWLLAKSMMHPAVVVRKIRKMYKKYATHQKKLHHIC